MITHFWRRVAEERRTLATWSEKEKAPTITNTNCDCGKGWLYKMTFFLLFSTFLYAKHCCFFSILFSFILLQLWSNVNTFYFHNVTFLIFEKKYNYVYLGIDWIIDRNSAEWNQTEEEFAFLRSFWRKINTFIDSKDTIKWIKVSEKTFANAKIQ